MILKTCHHRHFVATAATVLWISSYYKVSLVAAYQPGLMNVICLFTNGVNYSLLVDFRWGLMVG